MPTFLWTEERKSRGDAIRSHERIEQPMADDPYRDDFHSAKTAVAYQATGDRSPALTIAVIVPCYRVRAHILNVLATIGPEVENVYVVDDACPEETGKYVESHCHDPRVSVLYQPENSGVGGATLAGFVRAWSDGADIVVKLDGDGQMDASRISVLVRPLAEGHADYAKANRFFAPELLGEMPMLRLLGNSALSFITKISSGYWRVMDPTNGFIALHAKILALMPIEKIDRTYFFESDMLFRLNTLRAVVAEVPMRARYGNEVSNLRIGRAILPFAAKHVRCLFKRVFYNYFLRDFNLGSVQLVAGTLLTLFGVIFGGRAWWQHSQAHQATPSGTVMVAALPILIGIQLLLSAINYDILSEPRVPLHRQL
jgi:dolichol-phosphate mannosyltransferase